MQFTALHEPKTSVDNTIHFLGVNSQSQSQLEYNLLECFMQVTSLYQTNLLFTELFAFKFLRYFKFVQVYADGPL